MLKFKYNEYVCNILISIVYKKRNARCYLRAAAPACALNKSITLRIHGSHIDANKFCLEKATISISRWDCRQLLVFYVQFNCASIYYALQQDYSRQLMRNSIYFSPQSIIPFGLIDHRFIHPTHTWRLMHLTLVQSDYLNRYLKRS